MEHKKEEQSQSALDRLFSGVLQPAVQRGAATG